MSGFLERGYGMPLGGMGEFDWVYGAGLKMMLIFPNCSGRKCPIQKILNSTEKNVWWCHLLHRSELHAIKQCAKY